MICPKCGTDCHRDEVDVGVGVITGPWGCPGCGWSDAEEYDFSDGRERIQPNGSVLDQYGGLWPAESLEARAYRRAKEMEDRTDATHDASNLMEG